MTAPQGQEEYVRTTFEVEEWYCAGDISDEDRQQLRGEFRAWLAEHDAEVAARALREAAEAAYDEWPGGSGVHCTPEWLGVRADRIERQEATR